eukprot:SAG31_NODE_1070_length_10071_cov_6.989771_12_plen_129_part_00
MFSKDASSSDPESAKQRGDPMLPESLDQDPGLVRPHACAGAWDDAGRRVLQPSIAAAQVRPSDGLTLWTQMQREESKDWLALEEEARLRLQEARAASRLMFGPDSVFRMRCASCQAVAQTISTFTDHV